MNVFFSYAHEDEGLRDRLENHLEILKRSDKISTWHDRKITAGSEWAGAIDKHLEAADIILLLVSPAFIASDYCWDVELCRATERHSAGTALVIPIILRPIDWHGAPFGKLQALPKDGKPVTTWSNRDQAFQNVAEGLRKAIDEELARREANDAPTPRAAQPAPPPAAPRSGPAVRARVIRAKNVAGVQVRGGDAETAADLVDAGIDGEVVADEIEADNVAGFQHLDGTEAKS